MRRRSWFDGAGLGISQERSVSRGKRPVDSDASLLHPDPEDETHSDTDAPLSPDATRRGTWAFSGRRNQEGLGDWFKLKWWRKKWKDGEEEEEEANEAREHV